MQKTKFISELDRIDAAREDLVHEEEKLLAQRGWKRSCDHPGSVWLWRKKIDGVVLACDRDCALDLERSICHE